MIFGKKCQSCHDKYPKSATFHELRLKTADGLLELEICEKCADFFDKSAEVIMRGKRQDDTV